MAAKAVVFGVDSNNPPSGNADGTINLPCAVEFAGTGVPSGGDMSVFTVVVNPSDTAQAINDSIAEGAVTEGARFGYTIAQSDVAVMFASKHS